MSKDFSESDFSKRIEEAKERRRRAYKEFEEWDEMQLKRTLQGYGTRGAAIFADAIQSWIKRLSALTIIMWLFLAGLVVALALSGAHWLAIQWTEREVIMLTQQKAALQADIKLQEQTVERLKDQTWGVDLYEDKTGRYVIMPKEWAGEEWPLTINRRPAVALINK